jgi:hypothetical protein
VDLAKNDRALDAVGEFEAHPVSEDTAMTLGTQPDVDLVLELPQVLRQRRLGDVQAGGGAAEVAVPRRARRTTGGGAAPRRQLMRRAYE